ncbi:MAG: hypothetical protein ACRC0L_00400, partial [Angustibacter sp.]
ASYDSAVNPQECAECAKPASHSTATSRMLCSECYRRFVGQAGAATALIQGGDPATAIVTGVAAQGHADSVAREAEYQEAHRTKLAKTSGFWRRAWVRIVG